VGGITGGNDGRLDRGLVDCFANAVGNVYVIRSGEFQAEDQPPDNGELFLVHWTGTAFIKMKITDSTPRHLEHATFAPLSLSTNP
jgi:hypothetical protein